MKKSTCAGITYCLLCLISCGCNQESEDGSGLPKTVKVFDSFNEYDVKINGSNAISGAYEVRLLVNLKKEGLRSAGLHIRRPNHRGFMGGVSYSYVNELCSSILRDGFGGVGEWKMFIPKDEAISEYVFLIRKYKQWVCDDDNTSRTIYDDWRLYKIPSGKLSNPLLIPETAKLPRLKDQKIFYKQIIDLEVPTLTAALEKEERPHVPDLLRALNDKHWHVREAAVPPENSIRKDSGDK